MRPCTCHVRRGGLSGCDLYLRLRVDNKTTSELFSNPSAIKIQSADACTLLTLFHVRVRDLLSVTVRM